MRTSVSHYVATRNALGAAVIFAMTAAIASPASHAETRGYVISWFATATQSRDFKENCPQDKNGGGLKLAIRNLVDIGYTHEQATEMANDPKTVGNRELQQKIVTRARVQGKAASVYNYPDAVPDPNIETVTGRFAYGFDLTGKPSPNKFEDPLTHEKVDNQLWRAVGCTESFRAAPPAKPYPEELSWNTMIDSAPAWSVQISGDDLNHDGPVTVTLDRVYQHLERDAAGEVMSNATYLIDPSPRSHNVLHGQMKDGAITITPADVYLEAEMPYYFDIALRNAHMRFENVSNGRLIAYWGGFIDWHNFAYMYTARPANGADSIGIYHALKKMADADPDPKTGENRSISTTFRMEAVPAYLETAHASVSAKPLTAGATPDSVPYATPQGITLVDVTKIYDSSTDQFMWRRLGDADGKPLYTFDQDTAPNKSTCIDECAKEFLPFLAAKGAKASGDWSLVSRAQNQKQWAYLGKPLYRYSGEDPAGAPVAGSTATAIAENPDWYDAGSKIYSPKEGWKRAAYVPEKSVATPPGIALQSLAIANGFGLVDAMTRMTLYAVPASRKMSREWAPMYAPELAAAVKDFSIQPRSDGTQQWSYKGKRLYTYVGDYTPGDVNGLYAEKDVPVALVYRNFMPASIAINLLPGRGPLMMTKEGLSVYTEARYNLQYGGRETRTGYSIPYNYAKAVGTQGCVKECTSRWIPVAAPAGAQSAGFWEVATRADGTRQWAYKGSPLYTYVDDKAPGDIEGNNRHVVVYGDPEGKVSLAVTTGNDVNASRAMQAGSGFYWHLASLFY